MSAMMKLLGIAVLAGSMSLSAAAQVVVDMPPPPPRPTAVVEETEPVVTELVTVEIGDVALYRYSSARFSPRPTGPRFYRHPGWYNWHSPYYYHRGFAGTFFITRPPRFHCPSRFPSFGKGGFHRGHRH